MASQKPAKKYLISSREADLALIREVKKHQNLYSARFVKYEGYIRSDTSWKIIGEELKQSPQFVRNRWKRIRERFVRGRKKFLTGKGRGTLQNAIQEEMEFLLPYINHKMTNSGMSQLNGREKTTKKQITKRAMVLNDEKSNPKIKPSATSSKHHDTIQFPSTLHDTKLVILPGMHDYVKTHAATIDEKPLPLLSVADSVFSYPVKDTAETTSNVPHGKSDVDMESNFQVKLHQGVGKFKKYFKHMEAVKMDSEESDQDTWSNGSESCYNIEDDDELFCQSIRAYVEKFPLRKKRYVKKKLMNTLYELEALILH